MEFVIRNSSWHKPCFLMPSAKDPNLCIATGTAIEWWTGPYAAELATLTKNGLTNLGISCLRDYREKVALPSVIK